MSRRAGYCAFCLHRSHRTCTGSRLSGVSLGNGLNLKYKKKALHWGYRYTFDSPYTAAYPLPLGDLRAIVLPRRSDRQPR